MKFYSSFQLTAENCLANRAINYGDGLFETILVCNREIPLWKFHYQRLISGLESLKINSIAEDTIRNKILSLIDGSGSYIAKLVVFRDDCKRGYASSSMLARYYITVNPYKKTVVKNEMTVSSVKLASQKKFAGIKHLNRLEQVLAAQELNGGDFDDALMLDKNNHIIETINKNVILIKNGSFYTPRLNNCGVYGVALRWLQAQGYKLNWKKIEFESMSQYHGLIVCNSIHGFSEIESIDTMFKFANNHPIVEEIKLKWQRQVNF